MENDYAKNHPKRLGETIYVLNCFVSRVSRILNIGLSSVDFILKKNFDNVEFAVTDNMKIIDGIGRNLIKMDLLDNNQEYYNTCDVVIFTEVLEHLLYSDDEIIKKLRDVIKPGKILCFSVPNACVLRNRIKLLFGKNIYMRKDKMLHGVFGGYDYLHEYTFNEATELVGKYFNTLSVKGLNSYRQGMARLFNVLPKSYPETIPIIARREV